MSRSILSLYFLFRSWKRSEEICVTLLFWTAFKDGHSHRITENKWQNRRENRPFELYANSKSTQSSAEAAVKSCTLNQIFNDDNLVDVQKYRAISTFLIAFFFLPVESEEKRQVEQSFASTLRARRTVGGCGSRANYARGRTPWSSSWLPVHSAESVCDVAPFYFFIIMFYKSTYIRKTWVLVAVERQHLLEPIMTTASGGTAYRWWWWRCDHCRWCVTMNSISLYLFPSLYSSSSHHTHWKCEWSKWGCWIEYRILVCIV